MLRVSATDNFTVAKLGAFEELWAQSAQAGSTDLYVDVNRTDTYVADGTPDRPYRDFNVAVGVAHEVRVQFRVGSGGGTAGCQDARIEVWRVA